MLLGEDGDRSRVEEGLVGSGLAGGGVPDDMHVGVLGQQPRGGLDAVDAGHLPVHDHDIGAGIADTSERLLAGGGVADEAEAGDSPRTRRSIRRDVALLSTMKSLIG
jgi:hypothetical protein